MIVPDKEIHSKLTKNLLDLIILQVLNTSPMHGYGLIMAIRKNFGVCFGPSTVYPLLNSMEKKHLVKSSWDLTRERERKVFVLTAEGKDILDYASLSLRSICRDITSINVHANEEGTSNQIQFRLH